VGLDEKQLIPLVNQTRDWLKHEAKNLPDHRTITRGLAAFLAADVVGFSSTMEKDEEGTLGESGAATG
jgi:class 3 adenylate cyclase